MSENKPSFKVVPKTGVEHRLTSDKDALNQVLKAQQALERSVRQRTGANTLKGEVNQLIDQKLQNKNHGQ
jgi:hypothetical protein